MINSRMLFDKKLRKELNDLIKELKDRGYIVKIEKNEIKTGYTYPKTKTEYHIAIDERFKSISSTNIKTENIIFWGIDNSLKRVLKDLVRRKTI